jgi:hypothetical protein
MYVRKPYGAKEKYNRKEKGRVTYKSPYEMNFFCFDIKDFKSMDSITVYMPETKSKIKGVVTDSDNTSREITFNTSTENGLKTNINNICFLKEYDRNWLE